MKGIKLFRMRPLRALAIALTCALVIFANGLPAMALGNMKSKPTEGTARLNTIEKKAEEITQMDPYDLDLKETQARAQGGPNEVQGAADLDKMKRPDNSKGVTFTEQVENALDKATNKD
jgi:hypothetical protein